MFCCSKLCAHTHDGCMEKTENDETHVEMRTFWEAPANSHTHKICWNMKTVCAHTLHYTTTMANDNDNDNDEHDRQWWGNSATIMKRDAKQMYDTNIWQRKENENGINQTQWYENSVSNRAACAFHTRIVNQHPHLITMKCTRVYTCFISCFFSAHSSYSCSCALFSCFDKRGDRIIKFQ